MQSDIEIAQQAKLFGENCKYKVSVFFWNEFQMRLSSLEPAFAKEPARANRNHGLNGVKTFS